MSFDEKCKYILENGMVHAHKEIEEILKDEVLRKHFILFMINNDAVTRQLYYISKEFDETYESMFILLLIYLSKDGNLSD